MNQLIVIVGPTAVGKSDLALRLAHSLNGEIVSADSRQVYRYMDIGTAKPDHDARTLVTHHLIDIVDPDEDFSLALYQEEAFKAIDDIQRSGKVAFLVGGSGLYIRAVVEGLKIPTIAPDTELRRHLEDRALLEGSEFLYKELQLIDPASAEKIDPRNTRRLIRAIEVCRSTGRPFSELQRSGPRFTALTIGLTASREVLYRRIDSRVDRMLECGLVDEVKGLMDKDYPLTLPSMSSIGYKQIGAYLQGQLDMREAVRQIKHDTRRFARHQYAWFRPGDTSIRWFDIGNEIEQDVHEIVDQCLSGRLAERTPEQLSRARK